MPKVTPESSKSSAHETSKDTFYASRSRIMCVCVSQLQEAQKIIEQHFMKHFNKETSIISRSLLLEQRDSIGK